MTIHNLIASSFVMIIYPCPGININKCSNEVAVLHYNLLITSHVSNEAHIKI